MPNRAVNVFLKLKICNSSKKLKDKINYDVETPARQKVWLNKAIRFLKLKMSDALIKN